MATTMHRWWGAAPLAAALALLALSPTLTSAQDRASQAVSIELTGTIDPATSAWVSEALADAAERRAPLVIVRGLDTPGGLDASMHEIVQELLGAPMLILLIPIIDRMVRVDLRTVTLNIPPQEIITHDNVPARVNAVAYFRVIDPVNSVIAVERFLDATSEISQTTLRSVLGKADLDTLLAERERLNENLQQVIDEQTEPWGVKVSVVEIKDVEIPKDMQRAMARQAEAERNRRARVINAEAEFQAAERLHDASEIISRLPTTLQLRYLQTLTEIGVNQNTTVAFPIPIDLLDGLRTVAHAGDGTPVARAGEPATS